MVRLGDTFKTNEGYIVEVVSYKNSRNVGICFSNGYKTTVRADHLKEGKIKNPYHKSVLGMGFLGERGTTGDSELKHKWRSMLYRCYTEEFNTYEDCRVCEEWHNFSNFKDWAYSSGYRKDWELDKDILSRDNKMYSPDFCTFVPKRINSLIIKSDSARGDSLIGVYYHKSKKKYRAKCNIGTGKQKHIGDFNSELEAFGAYKEFKEKYIREIAIQYKKVLNTRTYEALLKYEVRITD